MRALLLAGTACAASFLLVACAPSPLRAQELRSGGTTVLLTPDGACSTPVGCTAGVLEVEQDLVQTGVSSQVELSVTLSPAVVVNVRENASTPTWELDLSESPPGTYLATLVVSGAVSQVVLEIP